MILHLRDGRWAAIEMKMGTNEIEDAAENLKAVSEKIDTDDMGKPSFLMILTAGQYASRRNDGIYVVPIGCLRD